MCVCGGGVHLMRSVGKFMTLLLSTIYIYGIFFAIGSFFMCGSEFRIEAFKQDPSWEALKSCCKVDLCLVADF